VFDAGGARIYFAGDTAYAPFFHEVRQRIGPIDVALLPIGAYEPRWFMHVVHMNPDEAAQAHVELMTPLSLAMHYGTFQLTAEAIDAPVQALDEARRARGIPPSAFRTLGFGESLRVAARAASDAALIESAP
jgi:L-ascorbate metabolism protein UlaG (beta-lactamase superfamily)